VFQVHKPLTSASTSKANSVLTYGAIVLFVAAVVSHLTSFQLKKQPVVDPKDFKMKLLYLGAFPKRGYSPAGDEADFALDVEADVRGLWTWNTKILYASIVASYVNEAHAVNQVVVWDKRLLTKLEANLKLSTKRSDYGLNDKGHFLRGVPVNFTLSVHEMPITGLLLKSLPITVSQTLPKEYKYPK